MEPNSINEAYLQTEIDALRAQYPDTQDLYREVCVILFFRHGVTPTANKLYQLVKKGSMSAPAEALTRFWSALREKSRVRIEHPDLPDTLRETAGEMVGALWQRAQSAAQDALHHQREDAQAQIQAAQDLLHKATQQALSLDQSLREEQAQHQTVQSQWRQTQADLSRAQGEIAALQRQIEMGVVQHNELQKGFDAAQQRFTHDLAQQRKTTTEMEERHATHTKRLLLDIDRERLNVLKLQKELDQARREGIARNELHTRQINEKQSLLDSAMRRTSELEGTAIELRRQRDQLNQDLTKPMDTLPTKRVFRPLAKVPHWKRAR